ETALSQDSITISNKIIMLRYDDLYIYNTWAYGVKSEDKSFLIESSGRYLFNRYRVDVDLPDDMFALTVRPSSDGDVIHLPNLGTKKISRIFIDEKIPHE